MTALAPHGDDYPYEDRDSPPPTSCGASHSFINIFACRTCRKQTKPRDTDEAHLHNVTTNLLLVNGVLVNKQHYPLESVPEEGSLRRPLTCKFGKIIRKEGKVPVAIPESSETDSGLGSQWRSLPNLRSPSLAVRAMTNKFLALTKGEDKQQKKAKKRARFQETVDVVVHDESGNPILMDVVALKDEMEEDLLGIDNMAAAGTSTDGTDGFGDPRANQPLRMECMDITKNPEGQKYFKCVVHISDEFDKQRVTIRATSGGTRLVLVAFRSEPLGDGTRYWQQHVQKFRLPHAINPHEVNAVLHSGGDLVIQAPIFEYENNT